MSLSRPQAQVSPVQKFLEYKSDDGCFSYWDKKNEENVQIQLPVRFIVLDERSTIKGFNEENNCGIYSNEVASLKEPLTVKTFKGKISFTGLYNDIKGSIKEIGGRFSKVVYAYLVDSKEMVGFVFVGSSFSSWLDKKVQPGQDIVLVDSVGSAKKGRTEYTFPIFTADNSISTVDKETLFSEAIAKDNILQAYFDSKTASQKKAPAEKSETGEEYETVDVDDDDIKIPFDGPFDDGIKESKVGKKPTQKKSVSKSGKCPYGHTFGTDADNTEDCLSCEVYSKCSSAS